MIPNAAHILVVDNDPLMREQISVYLFENDMRVSTAVGRLDMERILHDHAIDLVLIDLRLGGEDGMQLVRKLREETDVPVIIVTARLDEADRVMGLETAADDYVTKPFSNRELLARVRAVLRRSQVRPSIGLPERGARRRAYRFAGWELNSLTRNLTDPQGQRIPLSNAEFNLLLAFCEAPERILSRDQLLDLSRLHSDEIYNRSIDVQIFRLRRKIGGHDESAQKLIRTKRGAGYLFAVPVEMLT
ncbi:response regulator [Scleromatobacter humisilvae]|uniref:Response regulator n=1 Tax=Scleromatobacter humisilvae TaxID=2897159 RepID=A0A9X2C0G9_9BURK|nr:response regulator [Scleromatobacter humisilvae]MCK9686416.1 response regulator [Scleromatobacter humisilvae]